MAREQQTERSGERREENSGLSGKTHEVAEQAKQAALDRVDTVRQTTQNAREQTAARVRKLGATVRKVGEHLRVEDQNYIADRATDASERLDNFASYLGNAEISTLLRDTGELARRNPSVFFGSAFVIGLAAGRFLRSGSAAAPPRARATSEPKNMSSGRAPTSSKPRPGAASRTGAAQ